MEITYSENVKRDHVVILLGATWCGPCKSLRAKLNKAGVVFTYLDVDKDDKDLRTSDSVPELVVFTKTKDGWVRKNYLGDQPQSVIDRLRTP